MTALDSAVLLTYKEAAANLKAAKAAHDRAHEDVHDIAVRVVESLRGARGWERTIAEYEKRRARERVAQLALEAAARDRDAVKRATS